MMFWMSRLGINFSPQLFSKNPIFNSFQICILHSAFCNKKSLLFGGFFCDTAEIIHYILISCILGFYVMKNIMSNI